MLHFDTLFFLKVKRLNCQKVHMFLNLADVSSLLQFYSIDERVFSILKRLYMMLRNPVQMWARLKRVHKGRI